jgi:hypothetical protein
MQIRGEEIFIVHKNYYVILINKIPMVVYILNS